MAFKINSGSDDIAFAIDLRDGDLNITANGVAIGFIDKEKGDLWLFQLSEEDREKLPGLALSNGHLAVSHVGGSNL